MPIRRTINQNIPFLTSYQPYTLPSGTVECFTVSDMYDYNAVPVSFDYYIGESKDTVDFVFKNLTNETTLEVNVKGFASNALVLSSPNNVQSLVLKPLQSQSLKFKLNTEYLDRYDLFTNVSGTIDLNIKNVFNNTVSTKSGSISSQPFTTPRATPAVSSTPPRQCVANSTISCVPIGIGSPQQYIRSYYKDSSCNVDFCYTTDCTTCNLSSTPTPTPSPSRPVSTPTIYYCCFEDVTNPGTCIGTCSASDVPCNLLNNSITCSPPD